jgi:hypothetical protein
MVNREDRKDSVISDAQRGIDQREIEDGLVKGAEKINARGPVMLDQHTRLDKAIAGPGMRIMYFCSFPARPSSYFDSDKSLEILKTRVKQKTCDEENKWLFQQGVVYGFSYTGNDGEEIIRFDLSKDDCGY